MISMFILALLNNKLALFKFNDRDEANSKFVELNKNRVPMFTIKADVMKAWNYDRSALIKFGIAVIESGEDIDAVEDAYGRAVNDIIVDLALTIDDRLGGRFITTCSDNEFTYDIFERFIDGNTYRVLYKTSKKSDKCDMCFCTKNGVLLTIVHNVVFP